MTPRRDEVDALVHAARGRGVAVRELELEPLTRARAGGAGRRRQRARRARARARDRGGRRQPAARARERPRRRARRSRTAGLAARRRARGDRRRSTSPRAAWPSWRRSPGGRSTGSSCPRSPGPEAVLAAMDCGLFRSVDGRFGFRHDLLREAVVADLEDARRAHPPRDARARAARQPGRGGAPSAARRARRPRRRAPGRGRGRGRARDRAGRGGRLPRPRRPSCGPTTRRSGSSSRPRSPSSGAATPAVAESSGRRADRAAVPAARPPIAAPRSGSAARCATRAGSPLAQQGIDALDAGAGGPVAARGAAADPRVERGDDRGLRRGGAARSPSSPRSGSISRPRRCSATTCARSRLRAIGEGRLAEAEAALVASGEARRGAGRPDLAYSGWANAACIAVALGELRARARAGRSRDRDHRAVPGAAFRRPAAPGLSMVRRRRGAREQERKRERIRCTTRPRV